MPEMVDMLGLGTGRLTRTGEGVGCDVATRGVRESEVDDEISCDVPAIGFCWHGGGVGGANAVGSDGQ